MPRQKQPEGHCATRDEPAAARPIRQAEILILRLTPSNILALRLMLFIAMHADRGATIQRVAERYKSPRDDLMKVADELSRQGLLLPSPGGSGGLLLARPAAQISLGEILRATGDCLADNLEENSVEARQYCAKLPTILDAAAEAYLAELDSCSLADAVADEDAVVAKIITAAI